MSITDELRLFAADPYTGWVPTDKQQADLRAIADRIDAEHESACAEAYGNGVMSVPIALDESQWVKLPVDADGEYIHIGDRVENNERVVRIVLTDGSLEPSVYIEKLPNVLHEYFCNEISHYHAPTVEDLLREFALKVAGEECMTMRTGVVEEYAEKLREVLGE